MKQDQYAAILRVAQVMQEVEDKRSEMISAIEDAVELIKQLKFAMPIDDYVMMLRIRGAMERDRDRLSDFEMFERGYDLDSLLSKYRQESGK